MRLADALADRGQRCIDVQLRSEEGQIPSSMATPARLPGAIPISGVLCSITISQRTNRHVGRYGLVGGKHDSSLRTRRICQRTRNSFAPACSVCFMGCGKTGWNSSLAVCRSSRKMASPPMRPESVSPHISQFWGLGRVVSAEYPGLRCRLIDVDDFNTSMSSLVDLILTDSHENQIALRSGQLNVPRLVSTKTAPPPGEFSVDSDACYLITGGLGMLGRQAARWLRAAVREGCDHAVAAGANRFDSRHHFRDRAAGMPRPCAAGRHQPARGRHEIVQPTSRQELPPLKGVIHAGGVLDDGLMAEQTWSRFESVLAPKQTGSLLLHEMTAEMPLDFFILYSSAASVLGSPGQGNYATANAFLDGLAQQRVAAGIAGLEHQLGTVDRRHGGQRNRRSKSRAARPDAADVRRVASGDGTTDCQRGRAGNRSGCGLAANASATVRVRLARAGPRRAGCLATSGGDSVLVETLRAADDAERTQLMTTHVQNELQQILSLDRSHPNSKLRWPNWDSIR